MGRNEVKWDGQWDVVLYFIFCYPVQHTVRGKDNEGDSETPRRCLNEAQCPTVLLPQGLKSNSRQRCKLSSKLRLKDLCFIQPHWGILCASQNGVSTTAWRDRHIGRFPAILNHSWLPLRSPESPSQKTAGSEPARHFSYQPPSTKLLASQFLLSSGLIAPYSCSFCPVVPLSEQVNWAILPLSTEQGRGPLSDLLTSHSYGAPSTETICWNYVSVFYNISPAMGNPLQNQKDFP